MATRGRVARDRASRRNFVGCVTNLAVVEVQWEGFNKGVVSYEKMIVSWRTNG